MAGGGRTSSVLAEVAGACYLGRMTRHPLETKLNASAQDILTAIERGFRAQVDVKGKLAELFLSRELDRLKAAGIIRGIRYGRMWTESRTW